MVKNDGYNANIQPGRTVKLGFQGSPGNVENGPTNFILTGIIQEQEVMVRFYLHIMS